jgi:hypothetical protein
MMILISFYFLCTLLCVFLLYLTGKTEENLCDGYIYLVLQTDCSLIIACFIAIAIFIQKKVSLYKQRFGSAEIDDDDLERSFRQLNSMR